MGFKQQFSEQLAAAALGGFSAFGYIDNILLTSINLFFGMQVIQSNAYFLNNMGIQVSFSIILYSRSPISNLTIAADI